MLVDVFYTQKQPPPLGLLVQRLLWAAARGPARCQGTAKRRVAWATRPRDRSSAVESEGDEWRKPARPGSSTFKHGQSTALSIRGAGDIGIAGRSLADHRSVRVQVGPTYHIACG